ncbi:MAG: 4Fe-4S dicluster domain-containing protein [Proteobacteria bacterium]|nr:4Fe-4S dicluster domain-containing protein [Pseudomonadota bacterium]
MKKQLGFLVDAKRCVGCYSCAMACKNQYHQPAGVAWRNMHPLHEEIYPHQERAFLSLACNHCEKPICLEQCPVVAYYKREEDGVVVHEQEKCIGCGNCIRSCPYGAPKYNPQRKKAEKCSLCWERLDDGLKPACVLGCPTKALDLIDVNQFSATDTSQYPPGFPRFGNLNPSVRFRPPRQPLEIRRQQ